MTNFSLYNEKLKKLEYNSEFGRIIDLTDEENCKNYGLEPTIVDGDFLLEFANLIENKPEFENPKIFESDYFNKKKVYQAQGGRVVLSNLKKGKRLGLTKRKPAGWSNNFIVDKSNYFYHQTHILGDQLVKKKTSYVRGEFFLGTRYLNAAPSGDSMKTYEEQVKEVLEKSDSTSICYRVVPIFNGQEVAPRGVRMTAKSKEQNDLEFDIFIFNVYPEYAINYMTGKVTKEILEGNTDKKEHT